VDEATSAFDADGGDVVVGIGYVVAPLAVADFEIDHVLGRFLEEMMGVASSGPEAGAHAEPERRPLGVGDEGRRPARMKMNSSCLTCECRSDEARPGAMRVRLTPIWRVMTENARVKLKRLYPQRLARVG
jgi:hypothetical protein